VNSLSNFIKGIFIGFGAILPGISSGVICMIFGLYEKLLNSILTFFKDIKGNLRFLLPIICGIVIGILLFSNVLSYCFDIIPVQTKSLFIGFLLGSIYILAKSNIEKETIATSNISRYISFFLCFLIGIALIYLESINFSNKYIYNESNPLFLILSGFFMSMGIIIPGISSTVILMILGVYTTYLNAISMLNLFILFHMMLGIIIGSVVLMKIIQYLLNNYHSQTMFGIIGFSLGSIFILYPGYYLSIESLVSITLLVLGFFIGKNIKEG